MKTHGWTVKLDVRLTSMSMLASLTWASEPQFCFELFSVKISPFVEYNFYKGVCSKR